MKTSRPVDARLWAAREDPGLQSELAAEYTRPTGGCHEHAARFGHPQGDRGRTRVNLKRLYPMARTASSSPRTLCVNRGRASPQASLQEAERDAQDEDTLRAMRAASEPLQKLWPSEGVWKGVTWSTESGRVDGIRFLQTSQNMEMLPPEIGQLQALTWLDLSGCELTTLPREIGQLRALTWLKLYRSE
eukprot:scaffold66583_cov64-Phaeocystis_antarctica.AAC.10